VQSDIPPRGVLEKIDAGEWAELSLDCKGSRAVYRTRKRVAIYEEVQARLADIERLKHEGEEAPATQRQDLTPPLAAEGGSQAGASLEAKTGEEVAASSSKQAPQSASGAAYAENLSPAELGRKGGIKSAEKRRDKTWMQFAKDAALRLHKKNPALTLTEIAEKILEEWKSKKFQKVGFRALHGYLSRLVDLDELPRSLKKRTGSIPK
jgi:hypothetical protein